MKKKCYSEIVFIAYQIYIIPTNHDGEWSYNDYAMQKLFIPQRLMASGYFY